VRGSPRASSDATRRLGRTALDSLVLQSLRLRGWPRRRRRDEPLVELAARSEFCVRRRTALWVKRFHCAVGRFPGYAVFRRRMRLITVRWPVLPLVEFSFPPESLPVWPRRPDVAGPAPLLDFRSLQHIRGSRSTRRGFCLPAGVRPQGLTTLSTGYALESRAGFISHRRRSWDSPFEAFSFGKVPPAFPPG
jgi:hypothetical protein